LGSAFESGGQTDRLHTQVGDVFDVLRQNFLVQTDHRTVFKQIGSPFFFLLRRFFEEFETKSEATRAESLFKKRTRSSKEEYILLNLNTEKRQKIKEFNIKIKEK